MPKKKKQLRVGAFQFKSSGDIQRNLAAILRGIEAAARQRVRLLALPECALSGYAEIDLKSPAEIDRAALRAASAEVAREVRKHKLFVSLGTTTFSRGKNYNTLRLIGPAGRTRGLYHKRARYENDARHYARGNRQGTYHVDGLRVGLRLCFDFRFPEYFRELLRARADLVVMGFSMVAANSRKLAVARAHLVSRAAENGLWMLTANNCRGVQNCPTCLIDPDGDIVAEAQPRHEELITGIVETGPPPPLRANIVKQARRLVSGERRSKLKANSLKRDD